MIRKNFFAENYETYVIDSSFRVLERLVPPQRIRGKGAADIREIRFHFMWDTTLAFRTQPYAPALDARPVIRKLLQRLRVGHVLFNLDARM